MCDHLHDSVFSTNYNFFSGDKLVYHCDNEMDGVYGGIDETFEAYKCTDEGLYDIPNPSKQQLARGEHGWPLCLSQEGSKDTMFCVLRSNFIKINDREISLYKINIS